MKRSQDLGKSGAGAHILGIILRGEGEREREEVLRAKGPATV